ncbi:diacylglyceryl transferase [Croceibacterium mercuriale]|uniref:Phosphatidylglycerol--prolipoprotein diacylglyceryl transferase n=2 Tax=Croceibacterium mercuriale TaxID=1572751 RepID=A0A0B2BUE9_9SPHN|nr:diacylglyceryl transferase [Croceibacterium mercuriale]
MMIELLAGGAAQAIRWEELGLRPGIELGFFTLRYYSLAYLGGILLAYWQVSKMVRAPGSPMAQRHVDDLFFWCTLGIILGGRLGYAAFYQPALFTSWDSTETVPWALLRLWDGGMSFHGGLIGTTLAMAWVACRGGVSFIRVTDYVSVVVGFGMLFGRLANFINGELWGRPTDGVPWAMIFPRDPLGLPRHPSQLYEAVLEGLVVVVIMLPLFWKTRARWRPGVLTGCFVTLISLGRFTAEFFREADAQLAWVPQTTGLNMGQWLTIPLIVAGIGLTAWALRQPEIGAARQPATA